MAQRLNPVTSSDRSAIVSVTPGFAFGIHSLQERHHDASTGTEMLAEIAGSGLAMILQIGENLSTGLLVGFRQDDHLVT